VTETTNQPSEKPWAQTASQVGWAILIVATLYVCYFSHLGAIGFVGPDEPRYAWVARDMVETGDWVTPRLYGKPWFEKPPLYYWGAALCFKLFGVSEAAARLPSAISALLATLALAWLALRLYGAETARWLLLLLPTTVGMIGFSHAAATDMPFSGMFTVAMVAAAVVLGLTRNENTPIIPRTPWFALVLFGFFLGATVLAKGPAAIILCGGAVFFWALFNKRWRDAFRLLHPAAIAAFCLTALPWYILCARRNPDFFRVFLIEHNFKRYLTPEFQHIQPFWFYTPVVVIAVIPWIALFLPLARDARLSWKANRLRTSPKLFFLCWAAFTVLFFSVSKSKLPGYVLPAVPPVVLLLADACRHLKEKPAQVKQWTGIIFGLTVLGICYGVFRIGAWNGSKHEPNADIYYTGFDLLPFFIFLFGGIFTLAFGATRRTFRAFRMGVVTIIVGLLAFFNSAILSLNDLSARRFAKPPGGGSREYHSNEVACYELRRSYHYTLSFYFHRELPQWYSGDRQSRWVFTDFGNAADAKREGLECQVPRFIVVWEPIVVCENPALANRPPRSGQHE
jgi:4-amino-4-deoxy-L-arabinose transferase-like glycosyltransferase